MHFLVFGCSSGTAWLPGGRRKYRCTLSGGLAASNPSPARGEHRNPAGNHTRSAASWQEAELDLKGYRLQAKDRSEWLSEETAL